MPEISKARRTHELKCLPSMFQAVWDETMPFQVRNNDRDFMVGDRIVLIEWNPSTHTNSNDDLVYEGSTGRECRRIVTYVLRGGEFGIASGHCVLGLALPDAERAKRTEAEAHENDDASVDAARHATELAAARREGHDAGLRDVRAMVVSVSDHFHGDAPMSPILLEVQHRLDVMLAAVAESYVPPAPDVAAPVRSAAPAALGANVLEYSPPGHVQLSQPQRDDITREMTALRQRISDLRGDNKKLRAVAEAAARWARSCLGNPRRTMPSVVMMDALEQVMPGWREAP